MDVACDEGSYKNVTCPATMLLIHVVRSMHYLLVSATFLLHTAYLVFNQARLLEVHHLIYCLYCCLLYEGGSDRLNSMITCAIYMYAFFAVSHWAVARVPLC